MKGRVFVGLVLFMIAGWVSVGFAQQVDDIRELKLRDWEPRSMLKTTQSEVEKPAYPVIDVHNHLGGGKDRLTPERVKQYLAELDAAGVRTVVNLDGGWGRREAKRLEESFRAGAKGLKFHKTLGLHYRYKNGKLMPVDDPKLDLVWQTCARYGRPVMIHVADPAAFFTPLDRFN